MLQHKHMACFRYVTSALFTFYLITLIMSRVNVHTLYVWHMFAFKVCREWEGGYYCDKISIYKLLHIILAQIKNNYIFVVYIILNL